MIRINIILIMFFLVFLILRFNSIIIKHTKIEESIRKEYKVLSPIDSVNNMIVSTYYPFGWRGADMIQNVTLDNGKKYSIYIKKHLFTEGDVSFGEIVKKGVLLIKYRYSDTLIVKVNKKEYRFLLSDEL